jgi:hypothetical protein
MTVNADKSFTGRHEPSLSCAAVSWPRLIIVGVPAPQALCSF